MSPLGVVLPVDVRFKLRVYFIQSISNVFQSVCDTLLYSLFPQWHVRHFQPLSYVVCGVLFHFSLPVCGTIILRSHSTLRCSRTAALGLRRCVHRTSAAKLTAATGTASSTPLSIRSRHTVR